MTKRQTKKNQKNIGFPLFCKIGYVEYNIFYEDKIKDEDFPGKRLMGLITPQEDKIQIEKNKNEAHMKVTLLHEIIHGIDNYAAIGLTEEQTEAMSSILWDTMDRNYKVKQFIFG